MRIAIPHDLTRQEVRARIRAKQGKAQDYLPGMAQMDMRWEGDDHLAMDVGVMGQSIACGVDIADHELVVTVDLPAQLGFVGRMIEGAIREKGEKLLK